ncbi:MAG TPA: aspartate 1-decarboxylase [Dehalococcoidia bacterium]|nr:aspartate 1-decarboxylase [Dehalococcoidia bacterium]
MLRAKIHRATVTEANVDYVGSITLDGDLMDAADILPFEQVLVADVNNGERLETYAVPGERGSGVVCLNGASARVMSVGDIIIILAFETVDEAQARQQNPALVHVDSANKITRVEHGVASEVH